jgi:magnesium transporter
MFTNRRALAALEPRLRCTEVDENGNVILVDGEFKKTELIAKVRRYEYTV